MAGGADWAGRAPWACAGLLLAASSAAPAAESDPFYKGKVVSIYIGFAPGGAYDYFGRLVARHIGKHLPGNPSVVAVSMPGAGSLTAANYLYARAPRDGTAFGIVTQTVAIEEALETPGRALQGVGIQLDWTRHLGQRSLFHVPHLEDEDGQGRDGQ